MNIGKNEKGSITLFILIVSIFILIVLLIVNIAIINKNATQERQLEEISKVYNQDESDLKSTYEQNVENQNYISREEFNETINNLTTLIGIGGVEESGNNYIRFVNGIQIVWGSFDVNGSTASLKATTTVNLPKGFVNAGYRLIATPKRNGSIVTQFWQGDTSGNNNNPSATSFQFSIATTSATSYSMGFDYLAIGKWK